MKCQIRELNLVLCYNLLVDFDHLYIDVNAAAGTSTRSSGKR